MPKKESKKFAFYLPHSDTNVSPGLFPMLANVKKQGHQVDFFKTFKSLKKAVRTKGYDAVGLSTTSPEVPRTLIKAQIIKNIDPKTVIIVGGMGVHHNALDLLQGPIDITVSGEAKKT